MSVASEQSPSDRVTRWQDGDFWLGHLDEFPEYLTQGDSLADLMVHLHSLREDLEDLIE